MNKKQNAKLNMAQRVSDTFARYQAIYSTFTPMVNAVKELNQTVVSIRETQKDQSSISLSASSLKKQAAKEQMINSCIKNANALYVVGFTTGNNNLITLKGLDYSTFNKLTDNSSVALAEQIFDLSDAYSSDLVSYGIDQTEISSLAQLIQTFSSLISKPMDTIGERKQKTVTLAQLFVQMDSVFYNKLDKLIILFKQSEPDFYNEYRTARNVING